MISEFIFIVHFQSTLCRIRICKQNSKMLFHSKVIQKTKKFRKSYRKNSQQYTICGFPFIHTKKIKFFLSCLGTSHEILIQVIGDAESEYDIQIQNILSGTKFPVVGDPVQQGNHELKNKKFSLKCFISHNDFVIQVFDDGELESEVRI